MSNQNNVRNSSAHSTASTLRPRAARLISGLDEGDETNFDPFNATPHRIASPAPPTFDSRSASPIPPAHPQRTSPTARRNNGYLSTGSPKRATSRQRKAGNSPSSSFAGLWGNSLTALQGLASDFLGSDLATKDTGSQARARKPLDNVRGGRTSTSAPPSKWGPSAPTSHPRGGNIGTGTTEEQTAAFRARKKKDMLTGQESSYADTLGKFKRRLSDDYPSASAPPGEAEDREALVYLHHVKKDDTLAGITIRYNISANGLRKANRMWPNDAVQARKTLILPVDSCSVKGKPVSDAEMSMRGSESDALSDLHAEEVPSFSTVTPLPNGGNGHRRNRTNSASTQTSASAAASNIETEPPWRHDSWVLLPGSQEPTEIARLPRRALGYFPPARRKSNSYSDADTPSTSLDISRSNPQDVFDASNPPISPGSSQRPQRTRRPSNATNGYFPAYLTGPGGVGTMNKNVRYPGPAQDGLNKLWAKHLPDVAPPRNQNALYQPSLPLYTDEVTPVGSGAHTPAYPHGPNGGGMNLENVGGAIESWVRRIASKTVQMPQDRQQAARVSVGTPGRGAGGIGDLIEMTDEFEIGDDEEDDRGRQGSQVQGSSRPGTTATSYFDGAVANARVRSSKNAAGGKSGKHD